HEQAPQKCRQCPVATVVWIKCLPFECAWKNLRGEVEDISPAENRDRHYDQTRYCRDHCGDGSPTPLRREVQKERTAIQLQCESGAQEKAANARPLLLQTVESKRQQKEKEDIVLPK